ncbi:histidine kinase/DNA gyrase B/HSP90-like ATPase [Rhodopseudomonas thermotolerans]|uniref:Histidine kinase/DNA gyrase B/HSP90-like ATPase n=2 Tax=Rhodopseudomonas TaxID=1073 RepID=A0A336JU27_9BRAD|nr:MULTISPECIES: ATP-binding protein [Rhodopseudomonas]RED25792.1 histidine kinase/DNA gyrase B/HSP90-like ATPase [Rhodopseudomonas pentothenatexigens]REF90421.1 histidine kinase/DNA gyrase B/HSP90-like ATPase [Rhodopseudomonas thermotolerans]SSW93120.1 histidine kinase/DNA gyrase B/HSP90-like ATPase [Rhodopseudomonas pentothenatexigens]
MPISGNEDLLANANPSKSFFIAMLTRDIDLVDCILDLLDNSVDGIGEAARRQGVQLDHDQPFVGHLVEISFGRDSFRISDASGGIPIQVAEDYAFRFGRPDDAPLLQEGTIGLYGIGMKRAMFKMGNLVEIKSSTGSESFELNLNVDEWRRDPQIRLEHGRQLVEWSFPLTRVVRNGSTVPAGTVIEVKELYPGIGRQFDSPAFIERLRRMIARDYAFILSRGLKVRVNTADIVPVMPRMRVSDEFAPFKHVEIHEGVKIEITAGLADPPPDDTSATARNPDSGVYGWYVVCNDRVVVSADKSSDTGWGMRPVPAWHPQFIGFMGVVRFDSAEPSKLPWKTTKRDVEASNTFYQLALPTMIKATKRWVDYTNKRRADAKRLKKMERAAKQVPVSRITVSEQMRLPMTTKNDVVVIEYVREAADVEAAAEALGIVGSSPTEVGIQTFEYFFKREVVR